MFKACSFDIRACRQWNRHAYTWLADGFQPILQSTTFIQHHSLSSFIVHQIIITGSLREATFINIGTAQSSSSSYITFGIMAIWYLHHSRYDPASQQSPISCLQCWSMFMASWWYHSQSYPIREHPKRITRTYSSRFTWLFTWITVIHSTTSTHVTAYQVDTWLSSSIWSHCVCVASTTAYESAWDISLVGL